MESETPRVEPAAFTVASPLGIQFGGHSLIAPHRRRGLARHQALGSAPIQVISSYNVSLALALHSLFLKLRPLFTRTTVPTRCLASPSPSPVHPTDLSVRGGGSQDVPLTSQALPPARPGLCWGPDFHRPSPQQSSQVSYFSPSPDSCMAPRSIRAVSASPSHPSLLP